MLAILQFSLFVTIATGFGIIKPSRPYDNSSVQPTDTVAILGFLEGYFKPPVNRRSSVAALYNGVPYDQRCLLEIIREVIDQATAKNILVQYNFEFHYEEGEMSENLVSQLIVEFLDNVKHETSKKIVSPLILTPMLGCWDTDFIAPLEYIMDWLSTPLVHGSACQMSPTLLPYAIFHAKQSIKYDGTLVLNWLALFVDHYRWKEVAIVTYMDPVAIKEANFFINALVKRGIDVVDIQRISDFSESNLATPFAALRRTRARIVLFALLQLRTESQELYCPKCGAIYCASFNAGIRGPDFVLIFTTHKCDDCYRIYNHKGECSVWEQIQQSYITFHIDWKANDHPGYSAPAILKNAVGNILDIDELARKMKAKECQGLLHTFGLDPAKYDVANTFAVILLLLDLSDKTLRQRFNSSLATETNHTLVSEVLLQLASNYELPGSNIKGDSRQGWVRQSNVMGIAPFERDVAVINETNHFIIFPRVPIYWTTKNGNPPRDLSVVLVRNEGGNGGSYVASWTLTVIAGFVATIEILIYFRTATFGSSMLLRKERLILLAGCLLLVIGSVVSSLGPIFFQQASFYIRPLLVLFGLSITNTMIIGKTILFSNFLTHYHYMPRHISNKFFEFTRQSRKEIRKIIIIMSLVVTAFYVIWCISDPAMFKIRTTDPQPDPVTNIYYVITVEVFESSYGNYWIAALMYLNGLFLFICCFVVMKLRTTFKPIKCRVIAAIQKAVIYAGIIFASAVSSTAIVSNMPTASNFSTACWLLVYSLSCIYFVSYSPKRKASTTFNLVNDDIIRA